MSITDKYTNRISKDSKRKADRDKSIANGSGPIGKIFVFLIKDILVDALLVGFYNLVLDIFSDGFRYVDEIFFSDFKGFLAGKFESKKGFCFEYTYIRYFMTIMIPPMGVFLSRGISAWYNIIICAFLSLVHYFPGLIYAFIVIHNAPYANRYQAMKREKLKKAKQSFGQKGDVESSPLVIFGAILLLGIALFLISLGIDPAQKSVASFDNLVVYLQPLISGSGQVRKK
jgi:uncharacterized membrane protein YqaE (UPF0057 family)